MALNKQCSGWSLGPEAVLTVMTIFLVVVQIELVNSTGETYSAVLQ
jgi:hypothetical protein